MSDPFERRLDAGDEQLEFPLFYAVGRDGIASKTLVVEGKDFHMLLEIILDMIPVPPHNPGVPFQKN